jgi:hypothetical protein
MTEQELIEQTIKEDLAHAPDLLKTCGLIVNYLFSHPVQNFQHITFGDLSRTANLSKKEDVLAAMQYLCGDRARLLVPKFEFIEDDFIETISNSDVAIARKQGFFYHPKSGELVNDFEAKIFMFFELNENLK